MTDDSKTQLKNVLWSTMRYVTLKEGKSTDHGGEVLEFLKATSGNLDVSKMDIKDRIKIIASELKKEV
jgi:acyl-CoA thioester hydrolase